MKDFLKSVAAILTGSYGWQIAAWAWFGIFGYSFGGIMIVRIILHAWS